MHATSASGDVPSPSPRNPDFKKLTRSFIVLALCWTVFIAGLVFWENRQARSFAVYWGYGGIWVIGMAGLWFTQKRIRNALARRTRAEERLRKNEEKLRAYVDNISDIIWLIDADLNMVYVSPGVTRMLGLSSDELLGRPSALIIHPDDLHIVVNAQRYVMEHPGEPHTVQYRVSDKNGCWIYVESTGINLLDNPAINGVLVAMRDITERRQLEEALQQSEEKYRTVADFTHDWEFWIGPDEHMQYVSPSCERITGYPAVAFEKDASLLRNIIHPDDTAMYDEHRHKAIVHHTPANLEFRIIHADGSTRWISHVCQPILDSRGAFNGTRGSNRDITSRKEAEEERERVILEWQEALTKVKTLSGMLPICASCKKIRDDTGYWRQIEAYISDHSEAEFSHGICPDCAEKIYGKFYQKES